MDEFFTISPGTRIKEVNGPKPDFRLRLRTEKKKGLIPWKLKQNKSVVSKSVLSALLHYSGCGSWP